jgi:hypothetical protein
VAQAAQFGDGGVFDQISAGAPAKQ